MVARSVRGPDVDTTVRNAGLVAARRAEICRAAVVLARRVSFGAVTTREIAAEAQMNIATVYQYVRSKDDIVFLVCQQNVSNLQDELSASEVNPVRRLKSRFFTLMRVMQDRQLEITFVYQESRNLDGEYLQAVKDWDELVVDHFEEPLAAAHRLGMAEVENTRLAARSMVETGYAWANKSWSFRKIATNEEYRDVHWRWFERAFDLRVGEEQE
ncbi:MAG: TetR/AcrR family transcriptional regulator [Mycobacteriales bacterium]